MATETFSSIVVGYDDTEPAKRALAKAADLAEAFGAKLDVTSIAPVLVGAASARSTRSTRLRAPRGARACDAVPCRSGHPR